MDNLDTKMLTVFQKITDFLYENFGVHNFQIAKFLYMIGISAELLKLGVRGSVNNDIPVISLIINLGYYWFVWKIINTVEEQDSPNTLSTFTPMLVIYRQIITLCLLIIPSDLFTFFLSNEEYWVNIQKSGLFGYFVWGYLLNKASEFSCLYFASCKKPPKKTSKVREFIDSLFKTKQLAANFIKTL